MSSYQDRPSRALALLIPFLALFLASAAPGQQGPDAPRQGQAPNRRPLVESIWWNQPRFVTALELSEEQRAKMDASFEEQLEQRREQGAKFQELRRGFGEKAAAGDFAAARKDSARMGEAASRIARIDAEMMLDVLAHMSDAQREKLGTAFPVIFRRPWLMGGTGRGRMGVN